MMETFAEYKRTKRSGHFNYHDLLQLKEWQERRTQILERDGYACTDCGNSNYGNVLGVLVSASNGYHVEIHHKYYVKNWLPWEYSNDALITLCNKCHERLHESNEVPIYIGQVGNKFMLPLSACIRCNGTGYLPQFAYNGGVCFRCGGARYEEIMLVESP